MTDYFKINNYCKFYGETVIFTTAIMSDISKLPGYNEFTHVIYGHLANQIHRHIHVMLEFMVTLMS